MLNLHDNVRKSFIGKFEWTMQIVSVVLRHETQQIQDEDGQPPRFPFMKGELSGISCDKPGRVGIAYHLIRMHAGDFRGYGMNKMDRNGFDIRRIIVMVRLCFAWFIEMVDSAYLP